jgi:hypothetical protein
MPFIFFGRTGRSCIVHKWRVHRIYKDQFLVEERCNWCRKCRSRALRPNDEENLTQEILAEAKKKERELLRRERAFELRKGKAADKDRIREITRQLRIP